MHPTESAYLAGMIDGDGSIQLHLRNRVETTAFTYNIRLSIAGEVGHIRLLRKTWSDVGCIYTRKCGPSRKPLAEWTIVCNDARKILREVHPYLILKREQADVCLSLETIRSRWEATPAVRARQYQCWLRVKELNSTGNGRGTTAQEEIARRKSHARGR